MVVSRAIRASSCASCRLALIKSFTSVTSLPIRPAQARYPTYQTPNQRAQFSSRIGSDGGQQDNRPIKVSDAEIEEFLEEENAAEEDEDLVAGDKELNEELSNVPWYLQVNTPQRAQPTLSERQRMPDLPESSPEILEPMLKQISIDLGLDDLTLLDLRKLDPPPALGSNLIMVFGTARSEKHLHVAADRLCRWLRTNYKLRPDADGLLGRNELKLKLRRKSRRAKLMGTSQMEDSDDGVRTGWVCVNVGMVEGPKTETESTAEKPGFVGFGRRSDGINIVVQMLTEEKRAEIELEKLWEGILRRGTAPQIEEGDAETGTPAPRQNSTRASSSILSQIRGFHTSARRYTTETHLNGSDSQMLPSQIGSSDADSNLLYVKQTFLGLVQEAKFEEARDFFASSSKKLSEFKDGNWQPLFFDVLKFHLESLPREEVVAHLGIKSGDFSSTSFLTSFYKSLSGFPTESDWEARLWLQCIGIENGHPGYKVQHLVDVISEMQNCGGEARLETYMRCIQALLTPRRTKKSVPSVNGSRAALVLFQLISDRGVNILTEDILVSIMEATEAAHGPKSDVTESEGDEDTFHLPNITLSPIQERVHILISMLEIPPFSQASNLRLLSVYARQQAWPAFWETWRAVALQGQARSAEMYTVMFAHVAASKHEYACMSVLRAWVPEMQREIPPVVLTDDLKQALAECLLVAEPHVIEDAEDESQSGEWAQIWRSTIGVNV